MDKKKRPSGYDHSDPSLETTTPDVEYVNGVPRYKGRVLTHELSYQNAKVNEANAAQDDEDDKRDKYRMLGRYLGGAK